MTPLAQLLERLAALEKSATPWPWVAGWGGNPDDNGKDAAGPLHIVAFGRGGICSAVPIPTGDASTWDKVEVNIEFLAALRNAAPQLIRLVRAGEALAEACRFKPAVDLDEELAAWDEAATKGE